MGQEMKVCVKCMEKLPATLEFFPKDNRRENGLSSWCKLCYKEYKKEYQKTHKEKTKEYGKKWREDNPEKCREYTKKYREENKDKIIEAQEKWKEKNPNYKKKYREENKDKIKEYNNQRKEINKIYKKEYYGKNKDKIREKNKENYNKNREKRIEQTKTYRENNKEKINKHQRERKQIDHQFRLKCNFSKAISTALKKKGASKRGYSWEKIVNYTIKDLKEHLEKQFIDGMTWDNYGKWHVDHIIPQSNFTYTSYEDEGFQECWALPNLQPLWAQDNLRKHNKLSKKKIRKLALDRLGL